jgi:hypothetical protein
MDSLTALQIIVAVLVMFAASTVFSSLGFGIGLVGLPLLLLVFDTQTAIVLINSTAITLILLIYLNNRERTDFMRILPIGICGVIGALLGAYVLKVADETTLRIIILVMILIFTTVTAFNITIIVPKPALTGPLIGFLIGLAITAVGIGGPLLVLYMLALEWPRHTVRASMALFFMFMMTAALVGYASGGLYTPNRLILIGAAFVPALGGFYFGNRIAHSMNERVFRYFVVILIATSSVIALTRELLKLVGG